MSRRHAVLLLASALTTAGRAATYCVAPTGSDTNAGTRAAPFATPQKGLEAAGPGDTVLVAPGVYRGRVTFPRSGEPGRPIVLEGQPGAVLDGGEPVTGWELAPEVAAGVYRKTLRYDSWPGHNDTPFNLTYNDQLVLHISDASMGRDGTKRLAEPADSNTWVGVGALYGTRGGITYLRFADGQDPNQGVVTVGTHWEYDQAAVVLVKSVSHVVVRGFTLRNGTVGVMLKNGASDNLIEDNTIVGGKYGVFVGYQPWEVPKTAGPELLCHRNRILGNRITLDFISKITVPHPNMAWVWEQFKVFSDNDREGVALFSAGDDNEVAGNLIYEHWGGIQEWAARDEWRDRYAIPVKSVEFCRRLKVHHNVVHDILDDGLEPTGGEIGGEWHDNLVYRCNANLRLKFGELGPCYIYRNRFANPQPPRGGESGDLFHFRDNSGARVYVYHNSFASYRGNKIGANLRESPSPNHCADSWYVNNIWSNHEFGVPPYGGLPTGAHSGYNLVASVARCELRGQHNLLLLSQRLWSEDLPDFRLKADSPARGKGLDLSREWVLDGVQHPALPGLKPGYFTGPAPDLGALQYGERPAPAG